MDTREFLSVPETVMDQFSPDQLKEIEEGIREGLNVALYADKDYLALQMREIRLGLQGNLPVERYAGKEFDWLQMQELRLGLQSGVDIGKYDDPAIPFDVMKQIRRGLEQGMDLSQLKSFPAGILQELRKAIEAGVDIRSYISQGYEQEQLRQIRFALEKGVDIASYINPMYRGASIREVAQGLEEKLDVSLYADTQYNWQQMREIRLGLEKRLDVSQYRKVLYSWQQMREIRLGLEDGLDVAPYARLMYTAKIMEQKRLAMLKLREETNEPGETVSEDFPDFSLRISGDRMEALALVKDGEVRPGRRELLLAMNDQGVRRGIDFAALDILEKEGAGGAVTVARGKKPMPGFDGRYEFFFETDVKAVPTLLPDGSVDYKNMKWFEIVKKDQIIAKYHKAEYGADGYRVTGETIPAVKGKELPPLAGKGFVLLPDGVTYVAGMDGKIEWEDGRIEITDLLMLDDVTAASGNVNFNGSVYIRGVLGDGVTVRAKRDILVDGFVEAATLEAGGNIILRRGCNAGERGSLNAGGDIVGNFFEHTRVTAGGSIRANYCLNSQLSAGGKLEITGRSGMLAGGAVTAAMGVEAYNIGNAAGLATRLSVGNEADSAAENAKLQKMMDGVLKELALLRSAYQDFQAKYPPEIRNAQPIYLKIEDAIYTKECELGELKKNLEELESDREKNDRVAIVVNGTLFSGVMVEINGARWDASQARNVTLRKKDRAVAVYRNL